MKTQTLLPISRCFALAAALVLVAGASAAQPASESFDYPAGSLPGNGGSGWAGPWAAAQTFVVSPGLTYPGLLVSGNALGRTPGPAATRLLAAPIVGAAGTSVVLQALFRSDVPGTLGTQATLGNTNGATDGHFTIGDLSQQDPGAGNWGLQTHSGNRYYSTKPVVANVTTLLVAQIDFDVSGSNDRMRLWVNPPAGSYFTAAPDIDVTEAGVTKFSGVFWQTQQNQVVDEIRISSTQTACVQPPNTTMVAWYPFDATAGTTAANLATVNNGTLVNGPTWVSGVVARALRFDGVNDYVDSPSSLVTNFGPASSAVACSGGYSACPGDFSIDAWIVLTAPQQDVKIIVDKRAGVVPAIRGYSFHVHQGRLGLQLADGQGPGFTNYSSNPLTPSLYDGLPHHVAVTVRRNSPGGISFYHNGVYSGGGNPMLRPGSLVNPSPLRIGSRTAASPLSGWFPGVIDELEIYNRELTPQEVQGLFAAGPFGKCK